MDVKDLRIENGLGDRNDGSKYSHDEVAPHNRNKTYRDVGCNPLAKAESLVPAHVRPCAVIEPDRVAPPPASRDSYLKKPLVDPWRPCPDGLYPRPPEYSLKPQSTVSPSRNISPRQTFQENMPRILVPPTYSAVKLADESNINHVQDRNAVHSKNSKQTMAPEAKYCDVPYAVNVLPNEHKTARETEMCAPSVNSPVTRSGPHAWQPSGVNLHTPRAYGAHEIYQYPQYPSCAGPRPPVIPVARPPRTYQEEAGFVYPDSYYQDASIRFKPYPSVKERYPQARYDYISNYPNPFHPPPYAAHKFDIPNTRPLPYPVYSHLKYLDGRVPDHGMDGYQRPNQQPPLNYNTQFRNQVIHPTYAPPIGNAQNRVPSYPPDALVKSSNKQTYDNNKAYVDYENAKTNYPDSYFLNELARAHQVQKSNAMPNYTSPSIHPIPMQYHRKDNITMKAYEYNIPHYRHFEHQGLNSFGPQPQFSPSTLAISPTDSNTSNDAIQIQTNTQEDCGYASQSSTTSVRSIDSLNRLSNEYYRRYDYRFRQITGNSHLIHKPESAPKDNKKINVRQFWSMWNEGEEEQTSNNCSKATTAPKPVDNNNYIYHDGSVGQQATKTRDQLYVLGLVNVPNEELAKYEHIQKVSKLPENIKGYNSIELLNQFEEVIESTKRNNFTHSNNEYAQTIKDRKNTIRQLVEVLPRPVSPLDVESKISQSIIHKDVGCNFEIKPCSPKMLNVEIAAPVQNILGERSIEKVSNMLTYKAKSPLSMQFDSNTGCNKMQRQRSTPTPYENSSCKMVGSPFTSNNMESMKTNYSLQDLETSSGVCLASLPRLDNEIEFNFPEVNQQFINANKHTSTPQNIQEIYSNEVTNKVTIELALSDSGSRNDSVNCSTVLPVDDETLTDTENLSNNQKSKTYHSEYLDKESNANASRTDSVIIKNPENVRRFDENKEKYGSYKPTEVEPTPLNLTSQSISHVKESDTPNHQRKHRTSECALDYSLNKNEQDFYAYNDNLIKTTQIDQSMPDMTANSCLLSDDHIKINNPEGQDHIISKLSSECNSNFLITENVTKNISYSQSDCGSNAKDGTTILDFEQNATLETNEILVCMGQSETTRDKIINKNKHKTISDNLTMKHKHKHKNKHKTSKVKTISSNRFNELKEVIQNNDDITNPFESSNNFSLSKSQKQKSKSVIQINTLSEAEKIEATFSNAGEAESSNTNSPSSFISDTKYFEQNTVDNNSNMTITSIVEETNKSQTGIANISTEVKNVSDNNKTVKNNTTSSISGREDVVSLEINNARKYYTDLISESELFVKSTNATQHSANNSSADQDLISAVTKNSVDLTDAKDLFCINKIKTNIVQDSRLLDGHNTLEQASSISKSEAEYKNDEQGLDSSSDLSNVRKSNYNKIILNSIVQCHEKKIEGNSCEGFGNVINPLVDKTENPEQRVITDGSKVADEVIHETVNIDKSRIDSGYKSKNNSYAELEDGIFENYIQLNEDSVFVDHESNSKPLVIRDCSKKVDKYKEMQQQSLSDTSDFKSKDIHQISTNDTKLKKVETTTTTQSMDELDSIDANMRILFEDTNETSPENLLNSSEIVDDTQILLQVENDMKEFKDSQSSIQVDFDPSRKIEINLHIDCIINKSQKNATNKIETEITSILMESTESFNLNTTQKNELMKEPNRNVQLTTEINKVNRTSAEVLEEDKKGASVPGTARNVDGAIEFTEETSSNLLTHKDKDVNVQRCVGVDKTDGKKFTEETSLIVFTKKENGTSALDTIDFFGATDVKESTKEKNSEVLKKEVRGNDVLKPTKKINTDETDTNELIEETILKSSIEHKQKINVLETTEYANVDETDVNQLIKDTGFKALMEHQKDTIVLGTTKNLSVDDTNENEVIKESKLKALTINPKHTIALDTTDVWNIDKTDSNEFIEKKKIKALTEDTRNIIDPNTTVNLSVDETHTNEFIKEKSLTEAVKDTIAHCTTVNLSMDESNGNKLIEKTTENLIVNETDANAFIKDTNFERLPKDEKNNLVIDTKTNLSVDETDANELIEETITKVLTRSENNTIAPDTTANLGVYKSNTDELIEESMKDVTNTTFLDTTAILNVYKTDINKSFQETSLKALMEDKRDVTVPETTKNVRDETSKNKLTIERIDNKVQHYLKSYDETYTTALTNNEKCIKAQPMSKILDEDKNSSNVLTQEHINVQETSLIETIELCITTTSKAIDNANAKIITGDGNDEAIFKSGKSKKNAVQKILTNNRKYNNNQPNQKVFSIKPTLERGINNNLSKKIREKEKHINILSTTGIIYLDKTIPKASLTETSNTNIHANAEICMSTSLAKEKSENDVIKDQAKLKLMQVDDYGSNLLTREKTISASKPTRYPVEVFNIDESSPEKVIINTKSFINVQPYLNRTTSYYGYRSKELFSPRFQNLMLNNEGKISNIKSSTQNIQDYDGNINLQEKENSTIPEIITLVKPVNNTASTITFETACSKSYNSVSRKCDISVDNIIYQENTPCENKLSDNIKDSQLKELVDIENCDHSSLLDSTVEIGINNESTVKKQNNNMIVLESADTEESPVQNDLIHSQGISFQYPNNSVISQITEKIFFADDNDKDDIKCFKANNDSPINMRQTLKRSYSDSALNDHVSRDGHNENIRNLHYSWLAKRNKSELESIMSNNRRSSGNVGENISFCILIDDNCIITEESEDKICIAELEEDYITEINLENDECTFQELNKSAHETNVDIVDTVMPKCDGVTSISEVWMENVACVDTVFSDEVAENVVISAFSSPTNSTSEYDHIIDSESYDRSTSSHIDKVKSMLGEKMSEDDAHIVDTLYKTPHMNIMNKTLLYGEKNVETDDDLTDDSSDDVDQDRLLIEPNDWKPSLTRTPDYIDPAHTLNDFRLETPENKENVFVKDLSPLRKIDDYLDVSSAENETDEHASSQHVAEISKTSIMQKENEKVASCESSLDNVYENKEKIEHPYTSSSSSEVSSTTSEDKNSSILLKITNLNGSRVSQINEIKTNNRPRCKFTEKKEYSTSNYRFPNRPLLTKAAQKYIPPIKETIRDLKVKITLPQQSLLKFKQLKLSRNEPKINKQSNVIPRITKKLKPNFDDVLKSIDEMQRKKHTEKSKKAKSIVPKVVIKKNVNGSHYASTSNKDTFNPDLTGRRWQPWVFLEKSHFIDKMAAKNKTRAIYNHRKRTYVLKENFKKYKSASNTKFVISQPKTPGQLKYTFRLKHTY